MAKGSRGGKRTGGASAATPTPQPIGRRSGMQSMQNASGTASSSMKTQATQAAQPTQPQAPVQQVQPAKSMSASYNQFMSMSDDQKAAVITQNISQGVPAHLANNDFQKFTYNMGLNDKPDVVSEAQLKSISGKDVYRTVNAVYDSTNDINFTAPDIAKQITGGRVTRVSDTGGSVYGRGIYFATSRNSSTSYGRTRGNINKTAVVHAKLNSNAKVIDYRTAMNATRNEIMSGSKLGKALSKCDAHSSVSIYAMAKGYNVISDGMNDYMCVLNRNALTCSSQFTTM